MSSEQTICAICAWRMTCQKKFSMSGRDVKCTDFVKDVSLGKEAKPENSETDSE